MGRINAPPIDTRLRLTRALRLRWQSTATSARHRHGCAVRLMGLANSDDAESSCIRLGFDESCELRELRSLALACAVCLHA